MLYRSVSYINRLRTRNQAVPDQPPTTDGGGGSETYTAGGGAGNVRTTRQRTRAKSKTAGVVERPAVQQPDLEGIYEDDEEPDIGKLSMQKMENWVMLPTKDLLVRLIFWLTSSLRCTVKNIR